MRTCARLGLLLAAVLALAAAPATPTGAAFPGANGKIAFTRTGPTGEIYVFGGLVSGGGTTLDDCESFDGSNWHTDCTAMPTKRTQLVSGAIGGKIYAISGDTQAPVAPGLSLGNAARV